MQCQIRPDLVPRGRRTRDEQMAQRGNSRVLSLEREGGSRMNSDEIWVHEKEILTNQILLLICYICNIRPNITQRRSVEKVPINDWQASVTLILLVFHRLDLAS